MKLYTIMTEGADHAEVIDVHLSLERATQRAEQIIVNMHNTAKIARCAVTEIMPDDSFAVIPNAKFSRSFKMTTNGRDDYIYVVVQEFDL